MMETEKRLGILDKLYAIYDNFIQNRDVACNRGCAHCCTRNVTMTTLEGYRIVNHLLETSPSNLIPAIKAAVPEKRFKPAITINHMVRLCMTGKDLPEETIDPAWGPCSVLDGEQCPLYVFRPFGCRCMVSGQTCIAGGEAQMDPFVITVNTVFQQYIEHIDLMGCTGNFTDILLCLWSKDNREKYRTGRLVCQGIDLLPNRPLKMLMVPPEHQTRIQPILTAIQRIEL